MQNIFILACYIIAIIYFPCKSIGQNYDIRNVKTMYSGTGDKEFRLIINNKHEENDVRLKSVMREEHFLVVDGKTLTFKKNECVFISGNIQDQMMPKRFLPDGSSLLCSVFSRVPTVDGHCQFPYIYKGKLYKECIDVDHYFKCMVPGKNINGNYQPSTMQICERIYPRLRSMTKHKEEGDLCYFPFIYNNQEYTDTCAETGTDSSGNRIDAHAHATRPIRIIKDISGNTINIWPHWCYTNKAFTTFGECREQSYDSVNSCNYCENGYCLKNYTEIWCICHYGWVGRYCEKLDRCYSPSLKYEIPINYCNNNGICNDEIIDDNRCKCYLGYHGHRCQYFDPCRENFCNIYNTVNCEVNGNDFRCICKEGYVSKLCLVKKACYDNPCKNGGRCSAVLKTNQQEKIRETDYIKKYSQQEYNEVCRCIGDYTGFFCTELIACPVNKTLNKCKNGASCRKGSHGQTVCTCVFGYEGSFCEVKSTCHPSPCMNGGKCKFVVDKYECECTPEFEGSFCTIRINKCYGIECKHMGRCVWDDNRKEGYRCECTPGFFGSHCEERKTICDHSPCINFGRCKVIDDTRTLKDGPIFFVCKCEGRNTGVYCEVPPEVLTVTIDKESNFDVFKRWLFILLKFSIPFYFLSYFFLVYKERENRRYAAIRSKYMNIPKVARPSTNILIPMFHVLSVMFCFETIYRSEHLDPPQHTKTPEELEYIKIKNQREQKKIKSNWNTDEMFISRAQKIRNYDNDMESDKKLIRQIREKHRLAKAKKTTKKQRDAQVLSDLNKKINNNKNNNNPQYSDTEFQSGDESPLLNYEIV